MPPYTISSNSNGTIRVSAVCDAINLLEPELRRRVAAALREVKPHYGWIIKPQGELDAVY